MLFQQWYNSLEFICCLTKYIRNKKKTAVLTTNFSMVINLVIILNNRTYKILYSNNHRKISYKGSKLNAFIDHFAHQKQVMNQKLSVTPKEEHKMIRNDRPGISG